MVGGRMDQARGRLVCVLASHSGTRPDVRLSYPEEPTLPSHCEPGKGTVHLLYMKEKGRTNLQEV